MRRIWKESFGNVTYKMIGSRIKIIDADKSILKLANGPYRVQWVDNKGNAVPHPPLPSKYMEFRRIKKTSSRQEWMMVDAMCILKS